MLSYIYEHNTDAEASRFPRYREELQQLGGRWMVNGSCGRTNQELKPFITVRPDGGEAARGVRQASHHRRFL
jgi:hypothetical protein